VKEAREAARKFLADPRKALQDDQEGSFHEVAENFIKRVVQAKIRTADEWEEQNRKMGLLIDVAPSKYKAN
jgi:hypothetical protein